MAATRKTWRWSDRFDRAQTYSATPGHNGWTLAETSSTGAPTTANTSAGCVFTLTNNSQAEIACLFQNDILPFNINNIQSIEMQMAVSGIDSNTTLVFGVGSARDDTADSVGTNCWFRIQGSGSTANVLAETDDGTTDTDDKATGKTLSSTLKKFQIDFSNGLSDVRFFIDGERVAAGTTFSLAAASSSQGVQPIVQIQKGTGTGTPSFTLREFEVNYITTDGA